jgi:hypothetical protein
LFSRHFAHSVGRHRLSSIDTGDIRICAPFFQ